MPSWPKRPGNNESSSNSDQDETGEVLPLDVNFYFFLLWYALFLWRSCVHLTHVRQVFRVCSNVASRSEWLKPCRAYLAVALFFITSLFSLYRLSKCCWSRAAVAESFRLVAERFGRKAILLDLLGCHTAHRIDLPSSRFVQLATAMGSERSDSVQRLGAKESVMVFLSDHTGHR